MSGAEPSVPFRLSVAYHPTRQIFYTKVNGEATEPFAVSAPTDIDFSEVRVSGSLAVTHMGFPFVDENPAPAVGTILQYTCAAGQRFEHDWFVPTEVKMECLGQGKFREPPGWPKCVVRKLK